MITVLNQIGIVIDQIYQHMQRTASAPVSSSTSAPSGPPANPSAAAINPQMPSPQGQMPYGQSNVSSPYWTGAVANQGTGTGVPGGPATPPGGGPGSGSRTSTSTMWTKLLDVLNRLDQKLAGQRAGAGGGGGQQAGTGAPYSPQDLADAYGRRKMQQYRDEKERKFFQEMDDEILGSWGRTKKKLGQLGREMGGRAMLVGSMVGNAMAGSMSGPDGPSLLGALGGVGRALSALGPKGQVVGAILSAPQFLESIGESISARDRQLGQVSPRMAMVQAQADVRKMRYEQMMGERLAPMAAAYEKNAAEFRENQADNSARLSYWWRVNVMGMKNAIDELTTSKDRSWFQTGLAWVPGVAIYQGFKKAKEDLPGSGTKKDADNFEINDENQRIYLPNKGLSATEYTSAIGSSWWWQTYGRPPHWEK
jgi:hypothetical protein